MPMSKPMQGWYGGLTVGSMSGLIALATGTLDSLSDHQKLVLILGIAVTSGLIGAGFGYCLDNGTRLSRFAGRLLATPQRNAVEGNPNSPNVPQPFSPV